MNQSINTDRKNSKEPQQKYRLGTVRIKILGGLNRFYGRPTSPFSFCHGSKHTVVRSAANRNKNVKCRSKSPDRVGKPETHMYFWPLYDIRIRICIDGIT